MSTILNTIKQVVGSAIKVEVKNPVTRNGKTRYPVLVTDMSQSYTSGWFLTYNPVAQDNGTRLYDGAKSFSELHISRFSEIHNMVLTANHYFLQGYQVEKMANNLSRAIYEPTPAIRLTATAGPNSISVVLTITDESSPFHMMSIPFRVTNNNNTPYVVGTDNERWDRNTDTFKELNANFAPRKSRFHRVVQESNQPAVLRNAKVAIKNGAYAINQDGTFELDEKSRPEYIQVVNNEFKALAYIYEQAIMTKAFEMAIAQGLPNNNADSQNQEGNFNQQSPSAFVPSFNVSNAGAPHPNVYQAPAVPAPNPQQPPQFPQNPVNQFAPPAPSQNLTPQPPANNGASQGLPPGINADDLPFVFNNN